MWGALLAAAALAAVPTPAAATNALDVAPVPAKAVGTADGGFGFDAGADLRQRQEMYGNVPGMPGGGLVSQARAGEFVNSFRTRVRAWGEMRLAGGWRVYARLTDEFRWNPETHAENNTWPDELVLDNLYLEGKGLFDGFLDVTVGRQDILYLYGLDHIFHDGTPGDGSRTFYADMARATLKVADRSKLDLFFMYNTDDSGLRWGTDRSKHRRMTMMDPGETTTMDECGWGAVWTSQYRDWLDWQLFFIQKATTSFNDRYDVPHPWARRETLGFKLMPKLDDEWRLQFEGAGQVGRNEDGDWLSGWSFYVGGNWKSARPGWRPFSSLGLWAMSGDRHAGREDGGDHAWEPLWTRSACETDSLLFGSLYGFAWWSNMYYLRLHGGVEFGPGHQLWASAGPMWAAVNDGLGGGNGAFRGLLSRAQYIFPLLTPDKAKGERLEICGRLVFELFTPGDYYESRKGGWFFRWQIEVKF